LSEDFTEKEGRLQRRDTPHHLKNKRISSGAGKSDESEAEKVRRILAMVATGNQQSTSATSDDTDPRSSVKVVYLYFLHFKLLLDGWIDVCVVLLFCRETNVHGQHLSRKERKSGKYFKLMCIKTQV